MSDIFKADSVKREEIEAMCNVFKVVSDSTRLSILILLKERARNVSEIVDALEMEQSAVSHQLRVLREARLVRAVRDGKSRIYHLDDDHIFSVLNQVLHHIREEGSGNADSQGQN